MPDIIHLLPEAVANQIAAGEVVQRPASIVKELLENSVDAGARNITLLVREAGKSLIQVIDDGCGMSNTDARMAFERHATSKIFTAQDLFNIRTLGFRGEAMASIASVSRVELKTRRIEDEIGTQLVIEGGSLLTHEPFSCSTGTSVSVKNLFFNIPVRKNFLKSNGVEYKHVMDEFLQVALAYPGIRFVMINENSEVFHLNKGSLRQRIVSIFGKKYDELVVPVEEESPIISFTGFIGKPESSRKKRGEQFLFVNNRFIRNNFFNHAIFSAYDGLLAEESFPFYLLLLELPADKVDVNVHPTKTEVKFEDEKAIYSILKTSVKKALSQHHVVPSIEFDPEPFITNLFDIRPKTDVKSKIKVNYGNESPHQPENSFSRKAIEKDWKQLYEVLQQKENESSKKSETESIPSLQHDYSDQPVNKKIVQLHNKYIFTTIQSGIVLIHQQYAHERVLFEEYLEKLEKGISASQKQLFPDVLEFNDADFRMFSELVPSLEKCGFIIEAFGKRSFVVNGLPVSLKINSPKDFLEKVLENYRNSLGQTFEGLNEKIAFSMAVQAGVKQGEPLQEEEMSLLIDRLFGCSNPYFSPGGKPVLMKIDITELDKKFS